MSQFTSTAKIKRSKIHKKKTPYKRVPKAAPENKILLVRMYYFQILSSHILLKSGSLHQSHLQTQTLDRLNLPDDDHQAYPEQTPCINNIYYRSGIVTLQHPLFHRGNNGLTE